MNTLGARGPAVDCGGDLKVATNTILQQISKLCSATGKIEHFLIRTMVSSGFIYVFQNNGPKTTSRVFDHFLNKSHDCCTIQCFCKCSVSWAAFVIFCYVKVSQRKVQ